MKKIKRGLYYLKKYCGLPIKEQLYFWEAFVFLALGTSMIHMAKFSTLMSIFNRVGHDAHDVLLVHRLKAAIRRAGILARWRPTCYPQALTAKWMLTRRQQPCDIYLGTGKNAAGGFKAHAWTKSGAVFVTGEYGVQDYTVVAKFPLEK